MTDRLWGLDRKHRNRRLPRGPSSTWKESLADWPPDVPVAQIHAIFDKDDLAIIQTAYLEACAFLGSSLKSRQRAEISLSILSHVRRGVRDPHRLALKAIVSA